MTSRKPGLAAVSRHAHGARTWRRYQNYRFAAGDVLAPLVGPEVPKAVAAFPVGFAQAGETMALVALLGLKAGQNLFVAPDGRWVGGYVPAVFRTYPFRLADGGDKGMVLCVVEDESLLSDGTDGERFFEGEEGNTPSRAVQEVLDVLQQVAGAATTTAAAAALLHKHGLLVPWQMRRPGDETVYTIGGLFKVDEAAINALPPGALVELRDGGALGLAYAQLLSQHHIATLLTLETAHATAHAQIAAAAREKVTPNADLNLEFLNDGPSLDFSRLR